MLPAPGSVSNVATETPTSRSVHAGREGPSDGRENLTILSLSLPLPLFKQNDAAIGQAMTDMTQAEVERAAGLRDSEARAPAVEPADQPA